MPVRKKDGSLRICIDYRKLNDITPLRRYYIPSLIEIMDKVGRCCVISLLDLTSGFHQVKMSENSKELTTFSCPLGKFKYEKMPFGLNNAPAVFPGCN